MHDTKPDGPTTEARLVLEDGTTYEGTAFGALRPTSGEVVFNTAMTGYPESLTDPSYAGQILVTTYPILGNYGVPPLASSPEGLSLHLESHRIWPRAIIAQDYTFHPSHWLSRHTLDQWLEREGVTGMYGIDTRALTKHLRQNGSMLGRIEVNAQCSMLNAQSPGSDASDMSDVSDVSDTQAFYDPNKENLVAATSCRQPQVYGQGDKTVILVDCGVKHNIIRHLLKRGLKVVRVPWDYDFMTEPFDGLFISNGPGDPDMAEATVANIRKAIDAKKPICGICMGNQLLSKAAGASIYKLKYGHRGHNQPVRDLRSGRCYITSQNHGFAVDTSTLQPDWEPLFVNLNDDTNEGVRHKELPMFSAQFHPEACSGPLDTEWIFDDFVASLRH